MTGRKSFWKKYVFFYGEEYFKSKLNNNEYLFLKETDSAINNENAWVNHFNRPVFFFHEAYNSCGVLIAYLNKTSFKLNKQKIDKTWRI